MASKRSPLVVNGRERLRHRLKLLLSSALKLSAYYWFIHYAYPCLYGLYADVIYTDSKLNFRILS